MLTNRTIRRRSRCQVQGESPNSIPLRSATGEFDRVASVIRTDDSFQCSDRSDQTTESASQCSGGDDGDANLIVPCGEERAERIEETPPEESKQSRSPSSALAAPQSSRRSSDTVPDVASVSGDTSVRSKIKSFDDDLDREDDAYDTFEVPTSWRN